jgi:soluble lytic murein transglycosylase
LDAGNYEAAIAFADAIAERTGENSLYTHGRLAYFRATALQETGDSPSAIEGYTAVAREAPLSYYALLALNRLDSLDPSRTEALIGELRLTVATAELESIEVQPPELVEDDTFRRGILLLRLGLLDLARHQFDELVDQNPNDDGLLWIVTFLFDRAGAFHISHNIPRRRIASFLTAYPDTSTWDQWLLAYPTPFLVEVNEAAEERSLDPFLIYAIMREESGFNPRAESFANARGLMQLMLPTARDMARRAGVREPRERHLFRPATSIALGSEYLSLLSERYGRHPALTIAGYNGGQGNMDRWLRDLGDLPLDRFVEEIPYRQTRDYAKRVLMTYWIYRWLYAEAPVVALSFDLPGTGG